MRDREHRTPLEPRGDAMPADGAEAVQRIVERAADSTRWLSLALLDASIALMRAPDATALSGARHIATVAAKSGAVALRIPDCLAEATALANEEHLTKVMLQ